MEKWIKRHTWNKIALFFSAVLFVWCVWQHEIMMFPYIKQMWYSQFQFFIGVKVSWGAAYDITLLGQFIAYLLLAVALWFWE